MFLSCCIYRALLFIFSFLFEFVRSSVASSLSAHYIFIIRHILSSTLWIVSNLLFTLYLFIFKIDFYFQNLLWFYIYFLMLISPYLYLFLRMYLRFANVFSSLVNLIVVTLIFIILVEQHLWLSPYHYHTSPGDPSITPSIVQREQLPWMISLERWEKE